MTTYRVMTWRPQPRTGTQQGPKPYPLEHDARVQPRDRRDGRSRRAPLGSGASRERSRLHGQRRAGDRMTIKTTNSRRRRHRGPSLTRVLYRLASFSNALSVATSGNPRRQARYLANRMKARFLWRAGFWRKP